MPSSVSAADLVLGLLTENTPRMLTQAVRLLRSIRWFGGTMANARVVVCGVGALETRARETLESLGAEIRIVERFHPASPTGNRHSLIAELLDASQKLIFLLDCDTIVVRDPLPHLDLETFQAKIAPTPTVSDEVFERLFAHFKLKKPPRAHITPLSGTPTIPYFNAGVFAVPTKVLRKLAPSWRKYNLILADNPQLVAPCERHMHQAALSLALAETGVPYTELPAAMNFQINAPQVQPPPGFAETDPVIIHYHQFATDDGFLLPTIYPGAQKRIEKFHERMRAEGFVQDGKSTPVHKSRPIVVIGMHRSGTSLMTEIISAMGSYAGPPDELVPGDIFNPYGYWEHRDAAKLNREILVSLSSSWRDVVGADVARLSDEQHTTYLARAKRIAQSLQARGSFLLKDPRISLLLPLWKEALDDAIYVIAWREPMAVVQSLKTRDQLPELQSLALWEHYTREALRGTEGLPRVIVSYEELLADPMRVTAELHAALTRFGIDELEMPTAERLRQSVILDFNRSGRAKRDDSLLDDDQCALLTSLRNRTADSVPPTSARTLELLAEFAKAHSKERSMQEKESALRYEIAELDLLLKGVFESKSWRIGQRLTSFLRILRRRKEISAEDRWRDRQTST